MDREGLVNNREDGTIMKEVVNFYLIELTQCCLLRVIEINAFEGLEHLLCIILCER
jgi:hypothetical protein